MCVGAAGDVPRAWGGPTSKRVGMSVGGAGEIRGAPRGNPQGVLRTSPVDDTPFLCRDHAHPLRGQGRA